MGLWQRLDAIDRRIIARRNSRYDQVPPRWFRYGFVATLPLVFSLQLAVDFGGWWIAVLVPSAIGWCGYFAAALRWERAHRGRRTDEFDIAVDH